MYIEKGGTLFGFCPGKSTWDPEAVSIYQALVICSETGIMLSEGSLSEQPDWWVELLSWFLPYYSDMKFYSRARAILGDGTEKKGVKRGGNSR